MKIVPRLLEHKIGYGLYGGIAQYYIKGVDGTLAQLGRELPPFDVLEEIVVNAETCHAMLVGRT